MNKIELYLGDCLEKMKLLEDESIDLIATDCPYKIVQGGCSNKAVTINACGDILNKHDGDNIDLVKKGKIFEHNDIEFEQWLPDCFRVLKNASHCYIMINGRNLSELIKQAEKVGFTYQNLLVWDKGNATPNKWYMNRCEFIVMLRKGAAKNINHLGSTTYINVPNMKKGTKQHPTEKPIALMQILVENSSKENDVILDPFMGIGSTGIACINTNRKFIGIEMDNKYFEIGKQRVFEHKNLINDFEVITYE